MASDILNISGGCHCGAIRYQLGWPDGERLVPARTCSCSYCTRFGASWASHPATELRLIYASADAATRYRFGTATADFIHCSNCGMLCVAISEIDGDDYAVVNVNTFTAGQDLQLETSQSDFSGEDIADRLKRRKQRWIGTVEHQFAA